MARECGEVRWLQTSPLAPSVTVLNCPPLSAIHMGVGTKGSGDQRTPYNLYTKFLIPYYFGHDFGASFT